MKAILVKIHEALIEWTRRTRQSPRMMVLNPFLEPQEKRIVERKSLMLHLAEGVIASKRLLPPGRLFLSIHVDGGKLLGVDVPQSIKLGG